MIDSLSEVFRLLGIGGCEYGEPPYEEMINKHYPPRTRRRGEQREEILTYLRAVAENGS